MVITQINTERLVLKRITPAVFEYTHFTLSDEEALSFWGYISLEKLNQERNKFKKGLETFNKSFKYFIITNKENITIGWCGYHTWYTDHARAEIGYGLFSEEYKQRGLMTETMQAVLAHGFNEMNLHRVEAFVAAYNQPSIKLLEKFGFIHEGTARQHYWVEGNPEDSELYGLIKSDYFG